PDARAVSGHLPLRASPHAAAARDRRAFRGRAAVAGLTASHIRRRRAFVGSVAAPPPGRHLPATWSSNGLSAITIACAGSFTLPPIAGAYHLGCMRWFSFERMRQLALCASILPILGLAGCTAVADPGYSGAYVAGPQTSYAYDYDPYGPYYYGYGPYGYYCC